MKKNLSLIRLVSLIGALCLGSLSGCSGDPPARERSPKEIAQGHLDIAVASISENDLISALSHLLEAEKLDPENADIEHVKAVTLYLKHDMKGAIEAARAALKIDPKHSAAQNTLGKLLMDSGNTSEAVPHLEVAANDPLFRESYKALTSLGIIAYRKGDYLRAQKEFDAAILANSAASCLAHFYRGHIRVKLNDLRGAIQSYENATHRTCAGFADAHLALGVALERSGSIDQARRKYLEIQDQFPSTPIAKQAMNRLKALP